MLTLFPTLLSWQEASPLLIRVVLGAVYIYWGVKRVRAAQASTGGKALGIVDCVVGLALVVGFWTQLAAALVALDLLWRSIKKVTEKAFLTEGVNYYLVLLVLALSLLVTGAGWLAFDAGF
jgi:uncharacterized membrane protein YphA (DoxX/SURF4 family)